MNLPRISAARADRIVDIVAILLAISVAIALAALTWRIVAGGGRDHVAAAPPPPTYAAVDVSPVIQLAPFGTQGAAGGAASGPTSLPLILKAIFYREAPGVSTAVIGANGQPAKAIPVGENIAGLATLSSIERDHVVVNAGGQLQDLFFPGKMKTLLGQQAQAAAGQASPPPPAPPLPVPPPAPTQAPPQPPVGQSIAPASLPPPLPTPAPTPAGRQGAFLDSQPRLPSSATEGGRAQIAARSSVHLMASR